MNVQMSAVWNVTFCNSLMDRCQHFDGKFIILVDGGSTFLRNVSLQETKWRKIIALFIFLF